jgi:hypothetical protein
MSGGFRGGIRQAALAEKFKVAEGREGHDIEFFGATGAGESKWTMLNTTIGENQKITLGFQLVYGDELVVRVKEMFREYVAGAHAHYKFEVLVGLKDMCGGSVYVEIPDHRSETRGQSRETGSGAPLHECFAGRVLLFPKRMDGPVKEENQSACLCCS